MTDNEIKVSIIIPVYNTEKYIKQCIESLVNQTLQEIEIIFVDDGSTDNSLDILYSYQEKDKRVKILTQNHKKQGAARNYGISVAKGEYIGFVDSDDWCDLNMFQELYSKAKMTNSEITMCAVTTYNDNNSNEFSKSNRYTNLDIFPEEFFNKVFSSNETLDFLFDICAYPFNKIVKKDFLISNNLKFKENIYFEDSIYFLDIWLKAQRISLIKHFGYYYRMYSNTSTCFKSDYNKLDNIKTIKYRKLALEKNNKYKTVKKDFIKHKKKSLLYWFNKIQDKKVKILYFILMFCEMPSCALFPLNDLTRELKLYFNLLVNKNKKILFWGSSIFLEKFISKYKINSKNILGIIDKNPAKQNTYINNYKCYSPDELKELNPDKIIISILNLSKNNQEKIKNFINDELRQDIIVDII